LYTVYMEISKHVCVFFAKGYNRSTIIETTITKAVSPYTIYRDKKKQHHSTYCTVTEYKLT